MSETLLQIATILAISWMVTSALDAMSKIEKAEARIERIESGCKP